MSYLRACIGNIEEDGESVCGCDNWQIEEAIKLKEHPDKLMEEKCYSTKSGMFPIGDLHQ